MKKIPCLFVREFRPRANGKGQDFTLTDQVTPGLEWVLQGEGVATRKWDGTACMVRDGRLYKRYDAKKGKTPPTGAIPCDDPDPVTGHHPHWVLVGDGPEDKWHREAWDRTFGPLRKVDGGLKREPMLPDGTYELCGPHFSANPEKFFHDSFVRHGANPLLGAGAENPAIGPERSFEGLRGFLRDNNIEGIVFWKDGEPRCKIRRADYGLPWGSKGAR